MTQTDELLIEVAYDAAISVKVSFVAQHRWLQAPDEVKFLRDWHRHVFMVEAEFEVTHNDRELEFFTVQRLLTSFVREHWEGMRLNMSCEMFARDLVLYCLGEGLRVAGVSVSEDGENRAVVAPSRPSYLEPQTVLVPMRRAAAEKWLGRTALECLELGMQALEAGQQAAEDSGAKTH